MFGLIKLGAGNNDSEILPKYYELLPYYNLYAVNKSYIIPNIFLTIKLLNNSVKYFMIYYESKSMVAWSREAFILFKSKYGYNYPFSCVFKLLSTYGGTQRLAEELGWLKWRCFVAFKLSNQLSSWYIGWALFPCNVFRFE